MPRQPQARSAPVVEKSAAHRIIVLREITLAEHDLEQVRSQTWRAKHFGTGIQIGAPYAAKVFAEFRRIERPDLVPVAVEALGPGIQRQRIVTAQVLDVDDLEPTLLHDNDGFRQARDPAAGKHVLADVELGVAHADMADEVQHAEAAGLE